MQIEVVDTWKIDSHEVLVLYLGRAMERAPRADVYGATAHPYTTALMSAASPMTRSCVAAA